MKKVLLASTALVLSAGVAAADVAVSGDGRMGIKDDFGDSTDLGFTSRIRIAFSASGETDAGLAFGGSIRSDNSAGGASGTAGSVFVEGSFGKISMGDVSGAAEAAVGDVSGVGLTGLGDVNEMIYLSNNTDPDATDFSDDPFSSVRPVARYDYSFGDGTVYFSVANPSASVSAAGPLSGDVESYSVGADYSFGNFSVGAGWETLEVGSDSFDHWVLGGSAAFGDATIKATYGDSSDLDLTQWAISLDYVFGATTVTAFYRDVEATLLGCDPADVPPACTPTGVSVDADGFGLGVAYDLGGGAALKGGYVDYADEDAFDFGISMSF